MTHLFVSAELQVWQPSSHPSPTAPSSSQEPATIAGLQWPTHRQPLAQPAPSTSSWPSARHTSSSASAPTRNLYQLPPQPAAFPGGAIPLGQHLPQLSEHTTQHAITSHPQTELSSQRQSEQPLPCACFHHCSTSPTTTQLQPTTPKTPTKDIQKGAAAATAAGHLTSGEHRQQPVSLIVIFLTTKT